MRKSNPSASVVLDSIVDGNQIDIKFSDIIGLKNAKEAINEALILPSKRPDFFTGIRSPPKGILLYGPPGNGKTLLAKSIAACLHCKFFTLSAADLLQKMVGDSEKILKALFTAANCTQPCVIFIDEIDAFLTKRTEGEQAYLRRLKTEFLVCFDGIGSGGGDTWIFLLAATNRPQDLDSAALRRFQRRILVDVPNQTDRKDIIKKTLSGIKHNLKNRDLIDIAKALDGYSSSDIVNVCKQAIYAPLREASTLPNWLTMSKRELPNVTKNHFLQSVRMNHPSCSPQEAKMLRKWKG